MSATRDLVFQLELCVNCAVDELHHLRSRHYFVPERSDEENRLLGQHYSVFRRPEVALQEGERRQHWEYCMDHFSDVGEGVFQDQACDFL